MTDSRQIVALEELLTSTRAQIRALDELSGSLGDEATDVPMAVGGLLRQLEELTDEIPSTLGAAIPAVPSFALKG